ncbi:SRPBCC family protein [Streptomyces sp. ISL-94]|uniref:SRPBCC family protein n=1 Tax=Streptomyces sp. ISL-94 TaxID=2819190 RepID=UPI001BEAB5F1|nr:SRPBCC family protein [Streptomyces sp. ISL-94]MBT2482334.1 SRPBCC family protein [Streptomyces sp. ISL-94]
MAESALSKLKDSPAADRVKQELEAYLMAQAERLLVGAGRSLGRSAAHLNDIAAAEGPGLKSLALDGARKIAQGKGPARTAVELGVKRLKGRAGQALSRRLGRRGGKGGSGKPTVILESVDVGVDIQDAYNQWTRYRDFPEFARGVTSASSTSDTASDWNAKIFWSSRSWTAHITEQIPDERIAWTSEGVKGTTRGVVTFHALADGLTRVLLAVEYHPQGLVEKTGNLWRAQGRRVRLDLKNYARFLALRGEQPDGWRGRIEEGEVVTSHEEALAEQDEDDIERPGVGADDDAGSEGARRVQDADDSDDARPEDEEREDEEAEDVEEDGDAADAPDTLDTPEDAADHENEAYEDPDEAAYEDDELEDVEDEEGYEPDDEEEAYDGEAEPGEAEPWEAEPEEAPTGRRERRRRS